MPRSDADLRGKNEANRETFEDPAPTKPRRFPPRLHRAERAFRWIADFRNEAKFIVIPIKVSA